MQYLDYDEAGNPKHEFLDMIDIRQKDKPCVFLLDDPNLFRIEDQPDAATIQTWFNAKLAYGFGAEMDFQSYNEKEKHEGFYVRPRKGDIIISPEIRYRNDFLWIINYNEDEKKLEVMDLGWEYHIDQYGYLPSVFTFPEFHLRYWYNIIGHNDHIWIQEDYCHKILENVSVGNCPAFIKRREKDYDDVWSFFIVNGVKYWVVATTEMFYDDDSWTSEDLKNTFVKNIKDAFPSITMNAFSLNDNYIRAEKYLDPKLNYGYKNSTQRVIFMTCYWD